MDTVLSQTLNLEEKKVFLTFDLRSRSRDMTINSFETLDVLFELFQEEEIDNSSASEPQIKKHFDLSNFKI